MKYKKRITGSLIVFGVFLLIYLTFSPYYLFLKNTAKISPFKTLLSSNSIKKVNDTVNILILGIPGGTHDGPYLSDTIIVASYDLKKNRVVTISIPRDVWSDTLRDKINSAYAYGEFKQKGGGLKLAKAEVASIIGQPIQYAAVINFSGFKDLIDYVEGIDLTVQKSFIDHKFPIEGKEDDLCGGDNEYKCRYETISFKAGSQHMDGATALKFVRSRNAEGDEGSDFARNRREQLVISALKTKFSAIIKTLNLGKITGLYKSFDSIVSRDITNQEAAILGRKILFKKNFYQKNFHLSDTMFEVPDYRLYDGKYVLFPTDKTFDKVHSFVQCILRKENDSKCSS